MNTPLSPPGLKVDPKFMRRLAEARCNTLDPFAPGYVNPFVASPPLHLGNRAYIKAYYDRMDKRGASTGD